MEIYGVYFNYDTYESAASFISAHKTARGAYSAIRKLIVADYVEWFDQRLIYGKTKCSIDIPHFGHGWFIAKIKVCE